MENVIFFTMQRRTGISDLSLENICAMILSIRKIKPTKEIVIRDHLLICNKIPFVDQFPILRYGHYKYILEIKETLLIKRDRPVLNKNISSAKLLPFDNNQKLDHFYYIVILFYCSASRKRKDIKIPLCLPALLWKRLI